MEKRNYQDALNALGTLISRLKRSSGSNWEADFNAMHTFLERLELAEPLRRLKVIHVAGTKGKGSTCCMIESILRTAGYKTGLFTSPHLCDVRERIRINGKPVRKEVFLDHFWDCFETFKQHSAEGAGMPAYFRFLTLLGFKVFIEEQVDVAIVEVGLGGRLDATNILPQPIVCGISSLGFDHMELLGHTLRAIATEKAGIFKKGSPALTIPQPEEAQKALEVKAAEKGVNLNVVPDLGAYRTATGERPLVGLAGSHQEVNAALAIALAAAFEAREQSQAAQESVKLLASQVLPEAYRFGLAVASWPGRCQIVRDAAQPSGAPSQLTFYLDGAHTPESMAACAEWFSDATRAGSPLQSSSTASASLLCNGNSHSPNARASTLPVDEFADGPLLSASPQAKSRNSLSLPEDLSNGRNANLGSTAPSTNLLIFNCMQEREPERLLGSLLQALCNRGTSIHHALFVPPDSLYSKPAASPEDEAQRSLAWQLRLRDAWENLLPPRPPGSKQAQRLWQLPVVPNALEQDTMRGAVLPGLRTAVAWLRSCAKQAPDVRIQVLVTGSLYLVGDMLRHLGQEL